MVKSNFVVSFPEGFPAVTTGILLLDEHILITGHANGLVVKWDIIDNKYDLLLESDSPVRTISYKNGKIAVGYHSGGLYVIDLVNGKVTTLREPKHDKYSRIWRTLWLNDEELLITSTYGEITSFKYDFKEARWKENYNSLKGHSHSVFGIDSTGNSENKYVATGDYKGNIIVWEFKDNNYKIIQRLGVAGNVQDLCWYNKQSFAVITDTGTISIIESIGKEDKWQIVAQVDAAKNRGICIEITDDGKTILAGTINEIIQFDLDSYQLETIQIPVNKIFSAGNMAYVLNNKGLYSFEVKPIEIAEKLISYKFVKISLLGHTGTGKTTFCNRMLNMDIDKIFSTFGKKIFNLTLEDTEGIEKRIIFHDHGGQETVLDTFIPFLRDSDIILIFYRQTDKTTYMRAREILDEIREKVGGTLDIYFVQTFIDHEMNEIPDEEVQDLIETRKIVNRIKMSPKEKTGFDDFHREILEKINWDNARIMIQSPFTDGISKTFYVIQERGYPVIPFDMFKQIYQDVVGRTVSERHLKFLLEDYTNQGVIEYYPEISDLIIFNDEKFNKMRTDIPIYVDQNKGIVNINDLQKKFDNDQFLAILDEMYVKSGIAIKNGNLRIFPQKLQQEPLRIPESYKKDLMNQEQFELFTEYRRVELNRLIKLLSELELQCIGVSKTEGLFAWEKEAYIYYFVQEERRGITERYLKFTFFVGGNNQKVKERLKKEFIGIVERLYGPLLEIEREQFKKKESTKEYEFDVALSFAGEQREYVEKVATILKRKGIKVFYDRFYQSQLWGKNLVEYFKKVYYSKSRFCIMFISNDYLSKMWPAHERKSATARDLEEFGDM